MLKILLIGLKDVKIAFRDRAALIFMLAAPFALTLGLGFITGQFTSSKGNTISQIPVAIVDEDAGQLGAALVELFQSAGLSELLATSIHTDASTARAHVDADEAAAAVIVPPGFTASIIPQEGQAQTGEPVALEIYTNPTRPVSSGVIQAIVESFISRVETARVGATVTLTQLAQNGLISPQEIRVYAQELSQNRENDPEDSLPISLFAAASGSEPESFNPMAFMAPGMALFFLMFTVSNGGRSILSERAGGTLPRLLVSPTSTPQVLLGKVIGIYLTGAAQMAILIVTSSVLFGIRWGDPLGVAVIILAAVFGATGWGMLITSLAHTQGQVASIGTAVMLIFGILGGSFINISNMPGAIQWLSKITPNAWGLDGFTTLALGGGLSNLTGAISALLLMGVTLFLFSFLFFNRRSIMQM